MTDENRSQGSKKSPKPVVITLDGNIGAGKSTLLEEVRKACPEFEVCTEPVGEWMTIQDENGKSLVELFYEDKMRWAYTFQNLTILTRLKAIRDVLRTTNKKVVIMERSVLTDRYVFAELMKDDGAIDQLEYQLYLKWFDQFATELPLKGMIHVTTDVKLATTRIAKRGRDGEDNIPTEYLEALDKQHEKWLSNTDLPLLQLSTDDHVDPQENIQKIREWVKETYFSEPQASECAAEGKMGLGTPSVAVGASAAVTM